MVSMTRDKAQSAILAVPLIGCALVLCAPAQAQNDPSGVNVSLSETGSWNSNPMMRRQGAQEIYGATTTPRVSFLESTETSKIGLDVWLENNIFNRHEYDTTDYHAIVDLAKETQRLEVALKGNVDYDTTRTSELTNFGIQTDLSRHFAYTLTPTVGYALSPVSKIEMTSSYTKSMYEGNTYLDYHTLSFTPSYIRNFTELYAGVISLNARRYESDEGLQKIVDSIGPSIGVQAKMSPEFSAQLRVGAEASQEKYAGTVTQKWTWSTVFGSDVTYKGDQDTFTISASRAQQSYGNGNNALLTSFEAKEARQINPKFAVNIGGQYQFSGKDSASTTNLDTRYGGNIGLVYHVTQNLDLSTSYRYRHESYVNTSEEAQENVARLGLLFRPKIDALF